MWDKGSPLTPVHFNPTHGLTMRAARLTSGAEVTVEQVVVTTAPRLSSPADSDVTVSDAADVGDADDDCVLMTSADEAGIRRRSGRIDSGLPPSAFASETPTIIVVSKSAMQEAL